VVRTIASIAPKALPANCLPLLFVVTISCAIAYLFPYDLAFDRLTLHVRALRPVAMLFFWGAGMWLMRANSFSLAVVDLKRPVLIIIAVAFGVAIWCLALDQIVFRAFLPARYCASEQQLLVVRLANYSMRALNENVLYRLFFGSLLAFLLRMIWRKPKFAFFLSMTGMAAAQIVNVAVNILPSTTLNPITASWLILRFVAPGVLWSWLYVRHGFAANEGAAITVHDFLQPMVSVALALASKSG
jgi:hypothetical protein